jgi:hypothetical protein
MTPYKRVDHSHVVPAGYLKAFAVDRLIMMRLVGEADSRRISVKDAGVRKAFYRRMRPDGTSIDDVEWSLSQLEQKTLPLLSRIRDLWPLSSDDKHALAFLFGNLLVRGPRWLDWYESGTRTFVEKDVRGVPMLPDSGLATEEEIREFEAELLGSTRWTVRMLSVGIKAAAILGSMHWSLLEFRSSLLATSDHPVAPWPVDKSSQRPQVMPFDNGRFETLEFRVPISPRLAILMTWLDGEDPPAPFAGSRDMAANLNALTVAQAELQWFHSPERVPPLASGQLLALSRTLLRDYGPDVALSSRRRAEIQEVIRAYEGVDLPETIPMLVASPRADENTSPWG